MKFRYQVSNFIIFNPIILELIKYNSSNSYSQFGIISNSTENKTKRCISLTRNSVIVKNRSKMNLPSICSCKRVIRFNPSYWKCALVRPCIVILYFPLFIRFSAVPKSYFRLLENPRSL